MRGITWECRALGGRSLNLTPAYASAALGVPYYGYQYDCDNYEQYNYSASAVPAALSVISSLSMTMSAMKTAAETSPAPASAHHTPPGFHSHTHPYASCETTAE